MTVARYAHFSDEDINNSFMPRRAVADHEAWLTREAALSEKARKEFKGARLDVPYGDTPLQRLDIFPTARKDCLLYTSDAADE